MNFSEIARNAPEFWIFRFSISRVERLRLIFGARVGVGIGEGIKIALRVLFGAGIDILMFLRVCSSGLEADFADWLSVKECEFLYYFR